MKPVFMTLGVNLSESVVYIVGFASTMAKAKKWKARVKADDFLIVNLMDGDSAWLGKKIFRWLNENGLVPLEINEAIRDIGKELMKLFPAK